MLFALIQQFSDASTGSEMDMSIVKDKYGKELSFANI